MKAAIELKCYVCSVSAAYNNVIRSHLANFKVQTRLGGKGIGSIKALFILHDLYGEAGTRRVS